MASHGMNAPTTVPADGQVAAYLADLGARLPGPRRRREAILTELSDGLAQATEAHLAAGLRPDQAATAAIARFGAPQAVADAFSGELATAHARRTIAWFIATGPLVGIWWLRLLHPSPWRTGLTAFVTAIPAILLIAVAIAGAGATLATTGRLMRWLPETGPHRALAATIAIAALCVIADLTMITIFGVSGAPPQSLAVVAIAASLTRIAGSMITVWHATRMRRR